MGLGRLEILARIKLLPHPLSQGYRKVERHAYYIYKTYIYIYYAYDSRYGVNFIIIGEALFGEGS